MADRKTIYHRNGEVSDMYPIDAKDAVERFPEEWSYSPWSPAQKQAYERQKEHEARQAEAEVRERAADTTNGKLVIKHAALTGS